MRQGECEREMGRERERESGWKKEVGMKRDSNLAFYAQLAFGVTSGWKGREVGKERGER